MVHVKVVLRRIGIDTHYFDDFALSYKRGLMEEAVEKWVGVLIIIINISLVLRKLRVGVNSKRSQNPEFPELMCLDESFAVRGGSPIAGSQTYSNG